MRPDRTLRLLPERPHRLDVSRRDRRAEPQAGHEPAQVGGVVDARDSEAEQDVEDDQHPELADQRPALPIDRVVEAVRAEQQAEQPEDRARGADRRDVAAEREARHRSAGRAHQVEDQEAKRPVPALDDRPGEVQGVHVEEQVEQRGGEEPGSGLPCSSVTVHSRQYSPAATACLSSWKASYRD